MHISKIYTFLPVLLLLCNTSSAQGFTVIDKADFKATEDHRIINKKIILVKSEKTPQDTSLTKFILFKTKLQVNTDGTPISYHPEDLEGKKLAINKIGNGVAVYKTGDVNANGKPNNRFLTGHYKESLEIFRKYCASDFKTIPDSFSIEWGNVLVPMKDNKKKPCIFQTGDYKGYFASKTSLKNGLPQSESGECDCNNQVDPLKVNGFVIPMGKNALKKFNAQTGDLVIAYNPANNKLVYAIINDAGPSDKLGEGSVALNKALLDKTGDPHNVKETYSYSIPNDVLIAIIPASRKYNVVKPFNNENIQQRIENITNALELDTKEKIIDFLTKMSINLN